MCQANAELNGFKLCIHLFIRHLHHHFHGLLSAVLRRIESHREEPDSPLLRSAVSTSERPRKRCRNRRVQTRRGKCHRLANDSRASAGKLSIADKLFTGFFRTGFQSEISGFSQPSRARSEASADSPVSHADPGFRAGAARSPQSAPRPGQGFEAQGGAARLRNSSSTRGFPS